MRLLFGRGIAVLGLAVAGGLSLLLPSAGTSIAQSAPPTVVSTSGASAAAIQAGVDQYRGLLGANNGVGGTFQSGRREVNWDGVPDNFADPNPFPANFFNANSPRGIVYTSPTNTFLVSADSDNPTTTPVRFGGINPTYTTAFATFSPQRLFISANSNVMDVLFFIPGTTTPATVSGFGSVFTDVDQAGFTTIEYFNAQNQSLGRFPVTASPSGGLSFLGVVFNGTTDAERVARVRITSGNVALGPSFPDGGKLDVVAVDDFIYGEPRAIAPTPPKTSPQAR